MLIMCSWCLYKRTRNWVTMEQVRQADTIIAGDALCAEHFVDWTVLQANMHWSTNKVIEFLKAEKS